MISTILF